MVLPRAAAAGGQVVFEVRVAAADLQRTLERRLGQRRPAEVRVHDHARGVQRPPQARRPGRRQLLHGALDEVAGLVAGLDLFARAREGGAGRLDRELRRLACQALVPGELVHRRKLVEAHFQAV